MCVDGGVARAMAAGVTRRLAQGLLAPQRLRRQMGVEGLREWGGLGSASGRGLVPRRQRAGARGLPPPWPGEGRAAPFPGAPGRRDCRGEGWSGLLAGIARGGGSDGGSPWLSLWREEAGRTSA